MKNKILKLLLLILLFTSTVCAARSVYLIDDFEDGEIERTPEWWDFGLIETSLVENNKEEASYLEQTSLGLKGNPSEWYVGGIGTYLGIDTSPYNAIKLVVRGKGIESGFLRIELYDDDNNNWVVEVHEQDQSLVEFDDKFVYSQKVDWAGWKVLIIPFSYFVDDNPDMGDNVFNPVQTGTSGGLLQMQLILLATNKEVVPDIRIDTFKLFYYVKPKPQKATYSDDDW
ncbi:hypothetical protein DID80_00940 [Candidatus Marinamargulisbacteria bacterium SCGC AAA071-K20]|nr:hypothetical protein DID80_00940 [Candidatus Marinamargulisbacteria bacterium SCGC AAA071-K20]